MTSSTEKFKVGMEVIKDMFPEDAHNFLTETHSVSDCAASQFKHDHYCVLSLHPVGVRESALSVYNEILQGGYTV